MMIKPLISCSRRLLFLAFSLMTMPLFAETVTWSPDPALVTRTPLPLHTRVEVIPSESGHLAVVALAFPDAGFQVVDWGIPRLEDQTFHVQIVIQRSTSPVVLPVVTTIRHEYPLGRLEPGDYLFEVHGSDRMLAASKFVVRDLLADPPPSAKARIRVDAAADPVTAKVSVLSGAAGFAIADWGEPVREGARITIAASSGSEFREEETLTREVFQTYNLGSLDDGLYTIEFLLDGNVIGRSEFCVRPAVSVRLIAEAVSRSGMEVQPLRVEFRHPLGVDPASLDSRDLWITGPNGFGANARFIQLIPTLDVIGGPVLAQYELRPPGRVWTSFDNGLYHVDLAGDEVFASDGTAFGPARIGSFGVKIDAIRQPVPVGGSVNVRAVEGGAEMRLDAPNEAIVELQIGGGNVAVSSWGSVQRKGNLFWVDVPLKYTAEIGTMDIRTVSRRYPVAATLPGKYQFVVYSRGVLVTSADFTVEGALPPVARLVAEPIREENEDAHLFQVHFNSMVGMDEDSVRLHLPVVVGPLDFKSQATLLNLEIYRSEDGSKITQASYSLAPPEHGWDSRANGFYSVRLPENTIADSVGQVVSGGRIGGFHVIIPVIEEDPLRPSTTFDLRESEKGFFADLGYQAGDDGRPVVEWGALQLRGTVFVAAIRLGERSTAADTPQSHSYRLGPLAPGNYGFVIHAVNAPFASKHPFVIDGEPVDPLMQWTSALQSIDSVAPGEMPRRDRYAFGDVKPIEPMLRRDADGTRLLVRHAMPIGADDLDYRVEVSQDMIHWNDVSEISTIREIIEKPDGTRVRVVEPGVPDGGAPWPFSRIRALTKETK
jgi:hypothetical protein